MSWSERTACRVTVDMNSAVASQVVTLSAAANPGDVIVCAVAVGGNNTTIAASGLAGTWTVTRNTANSPTVAILVGTGITTAGSNFTITNIGSTTGAATATAYTGLTDSASVVGSSTSANANATSVSTTAVAATAGRLLIGCASHAGTTSTPSINAPTWSSGDTNTRVGVTAGGASTVWRNVALDYADPAASASISVSYTSGTSATWNAIEVELVPLPPGALHGTAKSEQTLTGSVRLLKLLSAASLKSEQVLRATLGGVTTPLAGTAKSEQHLSGSMHLVSPFRAATSSEQHLSGSLTLRLPIASWTGDDDRRLDMGVELGAWLWLEPTEVLPPAGVHISDVDVVSVTMPAPTLVDGIPVDWTPTTVARSKWGRYQIVVGGVDVSYWRGKRSRVASYASNEPFGDADAALHFPQVTEYDDLSTISWWKAGAEVTIRRRLPDGSKKTVWEGLLASDEPNREAHCVGVNYQLDLYMQTRSFLDDPVDLGHRIAGSINVRARHHGFRGGWCVPVDTGIDTREPGAGDPMLTSFIQNILSTAMTASGQQWTLALNHPRTPVIRLKDTTTVHWTVDNGAPGVTVSLSEDYTQADNVEYGSGTDGSCYWENRKFPNLHADTAPLYPLPLGSLFNAGDGHTGFLAFADELRTNGYSAVSDDTYDPADVDEVQRFQGDAGILVDGIVGPQTWAAAFQTGSHQGDLSGSFVAPLAEDKTVEPFLFNAQGAKIGDNPTWDPSKLRIEKFTLFGERVSKHLAIKAAKQMLARDKDAGELGQIVLTTDPHEGSRRDIEAGQNVQLRRRRGGTTLFHIARAEWDEDAGSMTLTVDSKARDLMTVASVHQRNRDVADPVGRPKPSWRTGGQVNDRVQWACEDGAGVIPFHAQFGGLWSVLRIPGGQDGQIAKVVAAAGSGLTRHALNALLESPVPDAFHGYVVPGASKFALAVFGSEVTANMLAGLLGNPIATSSTGNNPWDDNADKLNSWGLQFAMGGPNGPAGFFPHTAPTDGSSTGLTGRDVDAAGFPFESHRGMWLWVAIYTASTAYVGGRLFPGAPA